MSADSDTDPAVLRGLLADARRERDAARAEVERLRGEARAARDLHVEYHDDAQAKIAALRAALVEHDDAINRARRSPRCYLGTWTGRTWQVDDETLQRLAALARAALDEGEG